MTNLTLQFITEKSSCRAFIVKYFFISIFNKWYGHIWMVKCKTDLCFLLTKMVIVQMSILKHFLLWTKMILMCGRLHTLMTFVESYKFSFNEILKVGQFYTSKFYFYNGLIQKTKPDLEGIFTHTTSLNSLFSLANPITWCPKRVGWVCLGVCLWWYLFCQILDYLSILWISP